MTWTTQAPAKVNLDLRMRGLRADGYHLLDTVLQSIALADALTLSPHQGPFALTCDAPGVPTDTRNLAWKGAVAMAETLGLSLDGWTLHLEKQVPAEAGLGGGSADAAAAARLVAATAGRTLAPAELADVIRPLGADVAFFAWGGTMRGEGVGDVLTRAARCRAGRGRPGPSAVRRLDEGRLWLVRRDVGSRESAIGTGSRDGPRRVGQRPARPPSSSGIPRSDGSSNACARLGRELAAMSGSGSACFGLFEPDADLSSLADGWPEGTRVWHTALLDRTAYAERTACRRS